MHCLYLNEISLGKLVLMMGEAKLIPFNIGELVLTASQDLRLSQPTLPSPKLALVWKRGRLRCRVGSTGLQAGASLPQRGITGSESPGTLPHTPDCRAEVGRRIKQKERRYENNKGLERETRKGMGQKGGEEKG